MEGLLRETIVIPAIKSNPVDVFFAKGNETTQFEMDFKINQQIWDNIISNKDFVSCQFTKKGGNVAILSPSVRHNHAWQLSSFTSDLQAIGHGTYMRKGKTEDYLSAAPYAELLDELTRMSIKHDLNIIVLQKNKLRSESDG